MSKSISLLFAFSISAMALLAQKKTISDEEAIQMARHIESVTNSGRPESLRHFIDPDGLIENMRQKYDALNDSAFMAGFRPNFSKGIPGVMDDLAAKAKGGCYKLLREYDKNVIKHLLFRAFGDSGVCYHDYRLAKVGDSIRASDVYLYNLGEDLSMALVTVTKTFVDVMKNSDMSEEEHNLLQFRLYNFSKAYDSAKIVYDQLDSSRLSQSTELYYLNVCRHLSDSLYDSELQHFAAAYPNSPCPYNRLIDLYYRKKNVDKGLKAVNTLDQIVWKDPFLDFYRGNFYLLEGKKDDALAYYKKVYQYDPEIAVNTRQLIDAYADDGQIDQAKMAIREYKKSTGFRQDYLDLLYSKYPDLKK
jgi:tetratricopeptide (TPR) repeat protein